MHLPMHLTMQDILEPWHYHQMVYKAMPKADHQIPGCSGSQKFSYATKHNRTEKTETTVTHQEKGLFMLTPCFFFAVSELVHNFFPHNPKHTEDWVATRSIIIAASCS